MRAATPIINAFTAGELSRHLDGRTDHEKYYSGCRRLENFIVRPHGSALRRPGTRFMALAGNQDAPVRLIPFDFNAEASQSYVIELGHQSMRFFKDGGLILDGESPYCIAAPWGADEVFGVRFVQSADTLFLVHPAHAPRRLTRTGHTAWSLEALAFKIPGHDLSITDADASGQADGMAGDTMTLPDGRDFSAACIVNGVDAQGGAAIFRYMGEGTFVAHGADLTLTFASDPDHADNEIEAVYGAGGSLQTDFWEIASTDTSRPGDWGDGDWPSVAAFYEDRLVLGATPSRPLTLWFSRTGAFEDFRVNTTPFDLGVQSEPLADDSFDVTLSGARVNPIRWVVDQEDLLVGTNASEVRVWSGSEGQAMTPSDRQCKRQSANGSAKLPALLAGGAVLFTSRSGRRVREMRFDIGSYRYTAPDLTILAEHVTAPGVADMDYARDPHGILWVARADGVLAGCTYLREENVVAWHRHPLGGNGAAEAVACVPGETGDEVWLAVRRVINGHTVRMIERMDPEFEPGDGLAEAFFVDCGLSYHGEPDAEITGLDHLEGEMVAVLADGVVKAPRTVTGGTVTLDTPASTVHCGLAFASVLQPMRLEVGGATGTSQTKMKRVMAVTTRFLDTVGGRVCPGDDEADKYEAILPRRGASASGLAPAMLSGDVPVRLSGGFGRDGLFTIRQDDPLPMTVICLVPEVQVAG